MRETDLIGSNTEADKYELRTQDTWFQQQCIEATLQGKSTKCMRQESWSKFTKLGQKTQEVIAQTLLPSQTRQQDKLPENMKEKEAYIQGWKGNNETQV